jgi:hypothetical protein
MANWNPSSEAQYKNEVSRVTSEFQTHANTLRNRAPAVILGIQDAQAAVASAKSGIENGVTLLQTRSNELKSTLQSMLQANSQAASQIQMLETQVNTTKKEVTEAEKLSAIRKEQAAELQKKGIGNYHSSWLGLWRPLSDQSRFGLLLASIFFGIIAVLLIGYYGIPVLLVYFGYMAGNTNINFQIGSGKLRK